MKAFEKEWGDESCCTLPINCDGMPCYECRKIAEHWWREALKWARTQADSDIDSELGDKNETQRPD